MVPRRAYREGEQPVSGERIRVGGPFFEDFKVGSVFDDAPPLTLTIGHAAVYQALFGDRMRLPLDRKLSTAVTGSAEPYAHPILVCNVAIGQTTGASQRVRGNLFYRGLALLRPVFIGDTLRTRAEVVGLKQNQTRPGRAATGLVALKVRTENQHGQAVLDFWRCPMIPLRDQDAETGLSDSFDSIPELIDLARVTAAVPEEWRLEAFREGTTGGGRFADFVPGMTYEIEGRDTVTGATELARLTLNIAAVHTDAAASAYGRRLVYGGHTISMACAQVSRAIPNLVTILAWRSCDHTGPVFEGDILRTEVTVEDAYPVPQGGGFVDLRAVVFATRNQEEAGSEEGEVAVLDWRFVALAA
jgi:2-methylfumaryl-CoA hydratase